MLKGRWLLLIAVAVAGVLVYMAWGATQSKSLPEGFAASNGRIEAVEIDVATKTPGRLEELLVQEGDFLEAGQVLARMDTDVLEAQLREAEAELRRARTSVETAKSSVAQRQSEKAAAQAVVRQRQAELEVARKTLERLEKLRAGNVTTEQELDQARANFYGAEATAKAAEANVAGADAAIATAEAEVIGAEARVEAVQAQIDRLKVEIEESTLRSPREGRVQFRIAYPGEVLPSGGKVVNMVDLSDVYMTFFLPTSEAGKVQIGSEVRLVLDAAPQYVIPARVTFVADVAQFTPKTVETADERQKLMFRVKAHIDPELLRQYIRSVKTGLPGMAYVRLDPRVPWPEHLEVRLPPQLELEPPGSESVPTRITVPANGSAQ